VADGQAPPAEIALIPFSAPRLSERSGYGAGNRAPWFYGQVWALGGDYPAAARRGPGWRLAPEIPGEAIDACRLGHVESANLLAQQAAAAAAAQGGRGGRGGGGGGAAVGTGRYTAQLGKLSGDTFTPIGKAQSFQVAPLPAKNY
jgi:hypothetical protein